MKVMAGEEVKFLSLTGSGRWFIGKVRRVLDDVAIVEDKTGLGPRHVPTERLYPLVPRRARFA